MEEKFSRLVFAFSLKVGTFVGQLFEIDWKFGVFFANILSKKSTKIPKCG